MADRISHDQNFKNLILDYPRDALSFFAASEAPSPEDSVQITPIRQELLQERFGAHYRELDVPLKVEWLDGRRETILFILEEETDWHRFSLHRLGSYCFELAELCKSGCVVPVVIFLREADSVPASLTLGPKHRPYVTLDFLACKLKAIPYERWQHSDNLVARLNLPNMHIPAGHEINVYHQAIQGLQKLEPDRDKQAKYVDFIDIYARLTDNQLQQWQQQYPEESTTMTGFAQRYRDEGRVEGRVEGRDEGRVEGERRVLERQLQRRFGALSAENTERLTEASMEDLETWAENVLDAQTLDDVFDLGH